MREVYRVLEAPRRDPLKDAHAALDAAVRGAYGFPDGADYLASLLQLNNQVDEHLFMERSVTAPGIPQGFPQPDRLLSGDRIAL